MCLISNYKTDQMLYSDQNAYDYPDKLKNVMENRKTKIVKDFDAAMQQPSFNFNSNRPSVIITNVFVEASCHTREVVDYDGPKVHACSAVLKKFVYHRFKLLSSTEKTTFDVFGFSSEDWNGSDLVTAGKIAGSSVKHIPIFSVFIYCLS
jgi:hypothetical protein